MRYLALPLLLVSAPVLAQVAPLPANQFMASPSGSTGYLSPRVMTTADLPFVFPLSIANGGTGTATPSLVAGTGISISGTWPNQTVTNTATLALVGGTTTISGTCSSGDFMYNNAGVLACATIAGGGDVLASGTPTVGQIGVWVDATRLQGVNNLSVPGTLGVTGKATLNSTLLLNNGASAGNPILWATDNGTGTYALVPFIMTSTESLSVGDHSQHITARIEGTKDQNGTNDGSRTALIARQSGGNFASKSDFAVGAQLTAKATVGSGANGGTWVGANPTCDTPVGMSATEASCWGMEVDVDTDGAYYGKVGIGVGDLSTGGTGSAHDAGLMVYRSGGNGFKNGLQFGLSTGTGSLGVRTDGSFIFAEPSTYGPATGIDFSSLGQPFDTAAIKLAAGLTNDSPIVWSPTGGKISSQTTTGNGEIAFTNGGISFQMPAGTAIGSLTADGFNSPRYRDTGGPPTVSACGTSPAMTSGSVNSGGQFTMGTATPSSCTITFATNLGTPGWLTNAWCTVTPANAVARDVALYVSAQSATAFTITLAAGTSSGKYQYTCTGK